MFQQFWQYGDVEKVHIAVAGSTFGRQNVKNIVGSEHFWKLRCWKSARRCGVKHISKWKCTKRRSSGETWKLHVAKCTVLWREARFEVNMFQTPHIRTTFGSCNVEKVHLVLARSTFWSTHVKKRTTLGPLFGRSTVPHDDNNNNNNNNINNNNSKNNYNNNSKNNYTTTTATTTSTTTATTTTTRHYSYNYSYRYIALHYTYKHYTTLCHTTLHYHYNYNNYSSNGNYN